MAFPPPSPDYIVDPSSAVSEITDAVDLAVLVDPDPNLDGVLSICVEPGVYSAGVLLDATLLATSGPMPSEVWLYSSGGRTATEIDGQIATPLATPRGIDVVGPGAPDAPTADWAVNIRGFHVHDVMRSLMPPESSPSGMPGSTANWGGAALRVQALDRGANVEWMSFSKNVSAYPGGAVSVLWSDFGAGELLLYDNTGRGAGGAAYAGKNAVVGFFASTFKENRVTDDGVDCDGGGIAAVGAKHLRVEESWLEDNEAWRGGGVWLAHTEAADIVDSSFRRNVALERVVAGLPGSMAGTGGGLGSLHSGFGDGPGLRRVRIEGCQFHSNVAFGEGGGLWFKTQGDSEELSILGVHGGWNEARLYSGGGGDGGAGWFDIPMVVVNQSSFGANSAARDGGALSVSGSGGAALLNSTFVGNLGSRDGGALFASAAAIDISACSFIENAVERDGGAVRAMNSGLSAAVSSFTANLSGRDGGAVSASDSSISTSVSTFFGNRVARDGGALWGTDSTLVVVASNFVENSSPRSGGGVFATRSHIEVEEAVFERNEAMSRGGAVVLHDGGGPQTALVNQSHFIDNRVLGHSCPEPECDDFDIGGGAIYTAYPSAYIRSSSLRGNQSGDPMDVTSVGSGGAVLAQAAARLEDNIFVDNVAFRGPGGGVGCFATEALSPTPFTLDVLGTWGAVGAAASFEGNVSMEPGWTTGSGARGGGIGAYAGCNLNLSGVLFQHNWAPTGGGLGTYLVGVSAEDVEFRLNGLEDPLVGRPSTDWGGGAEVGVDPFLSNPLDLWRVRFLNNEAAAGGGGLMTWTRSCLLGGIEVSAVDVEWLENVVWGVLGAPTPWNHNPTVAAGGGWLNVGSDAEVVNSRFVSNDAEVGGGLASIRHGGSVCTDDPLVSVVDLLDVVVRSNTAAIAGGGMYLEDTRLEAQGGGFAGNDAGLDGGAIAGKLVGVPGWHTDPAGVLILDSLSLHENNAVGGQGGAVMFQGSAFSLSNVQVSENSSAAGPAIVGAAAGPLPSGGPPGPLNVDFQYATVAGNWVSGLIQDTAGVRFWDPIAAVPGRAVGTIDRSVIAFNHTPDPTRHWQVVGDQQVTWSNSISYAHSPAETNAALLVQTTGAGVTGVNPIFTGDIILGNSSMNIDPWVYFAFDYEGDVLSASPLVDPLSPADDLIGAFATGGVGDWCPAALVPFGCVPN